MLLAQHRMQGNLAKPLKKIRFRRRGPVVAGKGGRELNSQFVTSTCHATYSGLYDRWSVCSSYTTLHFLSIPSCPLLRPCPVSNRLISLDKAITKHLSTEMIYTSYSCSTSSFPPSLHSHLIQGIWLPSMPPKVPYAVTQEPLTISQNITNP